MADLAFLWHMHQPDYRHPDSGEFMLPWVLLHSIKDYTDMAAHLERHPGIIDRIIRIACREQFLVYRVDLKQSVVG